MVDVVCKSRQGKNIRLHDGDNQTRGEGGEALWTAPTKEREVLSKKRRTGSALSMNMKGGRTQSKEGHEWRKDTKGGRVQSEGGHKGRKDTKGGRT